MKKEWRLVLCGAVLGGVCVFALQWLATRDELEYTVFENARGTQGCPLPIDGPPKIWRKVGGLLDCDVASKDGRVVCDCTKSDPRTRSLLQGLYGFLNDHPSPGFELTAPLLPPLPPPTKAE